MKKDLNKKPKFSIIVPIYKVEKYLKKCVDSIINQTYDDFELLLVDDGSPDNCPKICDDYAKNDNRVKVIHKKNGGLVSARNAGVEKAIGEYICYVDGDDWISENTLEVVYNKAIKDYNPDMVVFGATRHYGNYQKEIPNDITSGLYNKEKLKKEIYPHMMYDYRKSFCHGLVFPVAWNKVYRTDLLKNHYCLDTRIRMGEDPAFTYECLYFSDNVYFIKDVLYYYNQINTGSMTSNYDANRFKNNQILTEYMQQRIGGLDSTLDSQINAFKAYWLIMAVFHEVKCNRNILESKKHIKNELKETKLLEAIKFDGLPLSAKCYLYLLKLHLYLLALIGAKVISKIKDRY